MTGNRDIIRSAPNLPTKKARVGEISSTSNVWMVFDIETNVDFRQRARIGSFQIKDITSQTVLRAGFFYDDLTENEIGTARKFATEFVFKVDGLERTETTGEKVAALAYAPMRAYLAAHPMEFLTKAQFVELLYEHWAVNQFGIAGHNLKFDMGALCRSWEGFADKMRGKGFSLNLCGCPVRSRKIALGKQFEYRREVFDCKAHPNVILQTLGGKKTRYSISDTACGPAIDTMVAGRALGGPGDLSLAGMGKTFNAPIRKRPYEAEHGAPLDEAYCLYLASDVLSSMSLLEAVAANYAQYGLSSALSEIYSEASIGKALFKDIGITPQITSRPFYRENGDAPLPVSVKRNFMADARRAYGGALSEVKSRLIPHRAAALDFLSEYPSVNCLMDLEALVMAEAFEVWNNEAIRLHAEDILRMADHGWLRKRSNWPKLRMFVRIDPTGCILPTTFQSAVNDKKTGERKTPFGLVVFQSYKGSRWFTLSDVIASKLRNGFMPDILEAVHYEPRGKLATNPVSLFNGEVTIDVQHQGLFKQIIEKRLRVKAEISALERNMETSGSTVHVEKVDQLKSFQQVLKLLPNSSAYGILLESNYEGNVEIEGRYYAPHIGAHITAGGRLLLALAETVARDIGVSAFGKPLEYCYCDTDGMGFAMPEGISEKEFDEAIDDLSRWFDPLQPYGTRDAFFAREDKSNARKAGVNGGLYFMGVSVKRYCFFGLEGDTVKLVKVSSHGTGDKMYDGDPARFDEDDQDIEDGRSPIVVNREPGKKSACSVWQQMMWTRAIERALGQRSVRFNERHLPGGFFDEPWNEQMTRMQVSVSTPHVASLFPMLNIRPYCFFTRLSVRAARKGERKCKLRIVSHFAKTQAELLSRDQFHDLDTAHHLDRAVVLHWAKQLRQSMGGYFAHPESKSEGDWTGGHMQPGWLRRPVMSFDETVEKDRRKLLTTEDLLDRWSDDGMDEAA